MASSAVSSAEQGRSNPRWRSSACRRTGVFLLGSLLSVLAGAAWLLSALLSAPLMLAGLWVWSREFDWADRLLHRFRRYSEALWDRVRLKPMRWGVMTVASFGGSGTAYWFLMSGRLVLA